MPRRQVFSVFNFCASAGSIWASPHRHETASQKLVGLPAMLIGLSAWPSATIADHHLAKPNIVFILADDLGYGDVACYNPNRRCPRPTSIAWPKEGMLFTDAHSPSTVCTPTRYSVLTGRMAFRNGMRGVFTGAVALSD